MAKNFKELYDVDKKPDEKKKESKSQSSAAAAILSSHTTKDKRLSVRINTQMFNQFSEINAKLGASNGSVINTLMSQYVREHKDLLEE